MTDSPAIDTGTARISWPQTDLENVSACPACADNRRELLYTGLQDYLHDAPGNWNMYRCKGCGCAYLDPRPTPASIGRAYVEYATHTTDKSTKPKKGGAKLIKRVIEESYRQRRYAPGRRRFDMAASAIRLLPSRQRKIDVEMRFMPPTPPGGRLLDLGCGNGDFLLRALAVGWKTIGFDIDPRAVAFAASRGLDVRRGDIDAAANEAPFDGITMSHVIEHVYDPLAVLKNCFDLLVSGGWLWLETPNINSEGHRLYGSCWRGLEPPRHLVLFNRASLQNLLAVAGFERIEQLPFRPVCHGIFRESAELARRAGIATIAGSQPSDTLAEKAEQKAREHPQMREFIALRAWKPA